MRKRRFEPSDGEFTETTHRTLAEPCRPRIAASGRRIDHPGYLITQLGGTVEAFVPIYEGLYAGEAMSQARGKVDDGKHVACRVWATSGGGNLVLLRGTLSAINDQIS